MGAHIFSNVATANPRMARWGIRTLVPFPLHFQYICPGAQARDKQIARLTREERLGSLKLSLANGKRVRVAQLRSFSRVVSFWYCSMANVVRPYFYWLQFACFMLVIAILPAFLPSLQYRVQ